MTEEEKKEYIRHAMDNMRGDNLERATRAFSGHDLTVQYGQSGLTKGEILEEYKATRARWQEAMDYLESLFSREAQ